jgi:hypothetical protein
MLLHFRSQEPGGLCDVVDTCARIRSVFDRDPSLETGAAEDGEDAIVIIQPTANNAVL